MMDLVRWKMGLMTQERKGARAFLVPTLKPVFANPCSLHP